MDFVSVIYVFANLVGLFGGIMLLVGLASAGIDGLNAPGTVSLIRTALACGLIFAAGRAFYPRRRPLTTTRREGVAVVVLTWAGLPLFGALPYFMSGYIPSLLDSYFEAMSGFTTCGATILTDVEAMSKGLHLWRSTTHWIGGMGIVVLFVAVIPALGLGGYFLYRAEVPGPTKDRIRPTTWGTSLLLWEVYVAFSAIFIIAYRLLGMNWFESVCHVFGGLATGGFSPKATSLGGYSPSIQLLTVLMMVVGGVNFAVWARAALGAVHRDGGMLRDAFRDEEFRTFLAWSLAAASVMFALLHIGRVHPWSKDAVSAAFQSVSISTNTGYSTENFDRFYPNACRVMIIVMMFFGGCAGSTCGGLKIVRVLTVFKYIGREIRLAVRPRTVESVRFNGEAVEERLIGRIMAYVIMYVLTFAVGTILLAVVLEVYNYRPDMGADYRFVTALSAQATCLATTGPGLAGSFADCASIPVPGKAILIVSMILGRLEILGVLAFLSPSLWRRA